MHFHCWTEHLPSQYGNGSFKGSADMWAFVPGFCEAMRAERCLSAGHTIAVRIGQWLSALRGAGLPVSHERPPQLHPLSPIVVAPPLLRLGPREPVR